MNTLSHSTPAHFKHFSMSTPAKKTVHKPATLEACHQQKMKEFEEANKSLVRLREELRALESEAATAEEDEDCSKGRNMDTIIQLRKQIAALERDDARLDYFLKAGPLLFTYFDAQESIAKGTGAPVSKNRPPPNSVLSFFTAHERPTPTPMPTPTSMPTFTSMPMSTSMSTTTSTPIPVAGKFTSTSTSMSTSTSTSMSTSTSTSTSALRAPLSMANSSGTVDGFHREKLLDQYMTLVDPESIKGGILPNSSVEAGWGVCVVCTSDMVFHSNEAKLFCATCGNEEFVLVDSEKPSYKDPPREVTYFAYKKINHFNVWLAQFQAKESTDIPRSVLDAVLVELRKQRIVDPQKITKDKIREILGRMKMPKLYTHATQIRNLVTQRMTNLTISKELEEKLQHMFKEIQPAFIKHCPPDRSNFISYSLCIYKLFQLLEMDEFLPALQLLKTRAKLFAFDTLWKKICEDLRWEFIPTI